MDQPWMLSIGTAMATERLFVVRTQSRGGSENPVTGRVVTAMSSTAYYVRASEAGRAPSEPRESSSGRGLLNNLRSHWSQLARLLSLSALILAPFIAHAQPATQLGVFESHSGIGVTPKAGSAEFSNGEYKITGGGANIWAAQDAFHFAWRRITGDFTITADIQFVGAGAVAHRKAVLMARQDLTEGSAYADAALHGDGLTSLQYRPAPGANTLEAKSDNKAPTRLRLVRRGNEFTMYSGSVDGELKAAGPVTVTFNGPVYLGLGVCSHDANVLETAIFKNVRIDTPQIQPPRPRYRSTITIYDLKQKTTRALHTADTVWEAPNWSPDGKYLISNSGGRLYKISAAGTGTNAPEKIALDEKYSCNNDHGPSPDGKLIAFSASTPDARQSRVYIANIDGSDPRQMTAKAPSYFHGWSPDGKWLGFVANRGVSYDVYRVAATGGEEQQLTTDKGYDDGSEYSPDGKWIYFNSDRGGSWNIWRIPSEGAGANDAKAERITSDDQEDWFPHLSPNGKMIVFLSFPPGTKGHNDRTNIQLRMIPAPGKKAKPSTPQTVVKIFGGQGTINVNSWSPDSKKFAYVVYEQLP